MPIMTWRGNPFFHPKVAKLPNDAEAAYAEAASASASERPSADPEADAQPEPELQLQRTVSVPYPIRAATDKLTGYQFFYIFVLDGLGAMVVSGGINFAIAYAMYTTQDTTRRPIRLFQLPNTLAGDAAVTIILQSLITWMVELVLVNRDLRAASVAPIGFLPQPAFRPARWFLFLDRPKELSEPGSRTHWALFLVSQLLRGFLVAILCFPLFWGASVGILMHVGGERTGGDWVFDRTWVPQVFKLLLGGLLALVTTPLFAAFWLVRCGWAMRTNERHYGER